MTRTSSTASTTSKAAMPSDEYRIPAEAMVRDTKAFRYAVDVVDGKIISGKRRIQACRRFLQDLERSYTDPDYPWEFDVALDTGLSGSSRSSWCPPRATTPP